MPRVTVVACIVALSLGGLASPPAHAQQHGDDRAAPPSVRDDEPAGRNVATTGSGPDDGAQAEGAQAEGTGTTTSPDQRHDDASLLRRGDAWGIFFSGGIPQVINRSADIAIVQAGVRWSHLWGRVGDGFLGGHPAFAVELLPLMTFDQEPRSFAAGFNLLYEHHFATDGPLIPVWRIGAGALYASEPTPPQETQHNFSLLTGLGLEIPVQDRLSLSLEYRFHHVSNADSGFRNPGINAHTAVVGITFR